MRRTATALLTSCLLAVSACSTGGSSAPSQPSEADVVAWMDKVCAAVDPTSKLLADEPKFDLTDESTLKSGLSEWLGAKVTSVEKSLDDLKALEDGPHPKSKELVGTAESGLGQVRTLLSDTKSKVDSSADTTQIVTAFTEMAAKASEMDGQASNVRRKLGETGLTPAALKAGSCKDLDLSSSSAPTS
ncbi:hypothetical protein [Lentzea sp. NPDC059081]|uniref:hypothetical protein n=1 Tax=Lentzea sp. NPDC059081 TaxID=3346719 RepID=UPI0036ABBBFE